MPFLKYVVIFFVLLSVLLGVSTDVQSGRGLNAVSIQQEWRFGDRLAQGISRKVNIVTDPFSVAYVNQLGQRIVQQTELRNLPWQFQIIRDNDVNAFNIPGGHVYIYTGLVQETDTESELVGVMAHEIAHGVKRHATEALIRQYQLRTLGSILLGQNPPAYERLLAQIVGAGYLAKHSRDDEREADRLGAYYMYQAGFDPNGMVIFFQKILAEENRQPGRLARLFSSHPLTQERIRNVSYEISRFPPRSGLITDEPQFHTFKNNLLGRGATYGRWGIGPGPGRNRY
ncbi:MAG TPA: M48 family metallopeptidase [Candidatus Limnocylindrales bacterium]|nr:M48 family metallopeptidase [Candidatus Limnocylindrales bacterium]